MNTTAKTRARKAPAVARPTFEQMTALALDRAEERLTWLISIRCEDEAWNDDDVNVDFAVELALMQIRRMKTEVVSDSSGFLTQWFRAGAAIELGCKAFSRDACHYRWSLESTCAMFTQVAGLVEFLGNTSH